MAKVIVGMTISLDGFVADQNGNAGRRYPDLAGDQFDFVEDKRESRRLLVQDNTEEGRVDMETVIVVFNEAEFPEFVHGLHASAFASRNSESRNKTSVPRLPPSLRSR